MVIVNFVGAFVGLIQPLFQTTEGYTEKVSSNIAKETVKYESLVAQVELLAGGELTYSCSRRLSERGWGLYMIQNESLLYICSDRERSSVREEQIAREDERNLCKKVPLPVQ